MAEIESAYTVGTPEACSDLGRGHIRSHPTHHRNVGPGAVDVTGELGPVPY